MKLLLIFIIILNCFLIRSIERKHSYFSQEAYNKYKKNRVQYIKNKWPNLPLDIHESIYNFYIISKEEFEKNTKELVCEIKKNTKKLNYLTKNKNVLRVQKLLAMGADVDAIDNNGFTNLMNSVFKRKYRIAELLIAYGADVNAIDNGLGCNALVHAAHKGYQEMIQLLKKHGSVIPYNMINDQLKSLML